MDETRESLVLLQRNLADQKWQYPAMTIQLGLSNVHWTKCLTFVQDSSKFTLFKMCRFLFGRLGGLRVEGAVVSNIHRRDMGGSADVMCLMSEYVKDKAILLLSPWAAPASGICRDCWQYDLSCRCALCARLVNYTSRRNDFYVRTCYQRTVSLRLKFRRRTHQTAAVSPEDVRIR